VCVCVCATQSSHRSSSFTVRGGG